MKKPAIIAIEKITKTFSSNQPPAVNNVSFTIDRGDLLGLLGPSGCGKTTLLRIIAGFERPSKGTIELAGKVVTGYNLWLPPEQRQTGMVFQDYALFPHLTVGENIAFGLKTKKRRFSKKQIKERICELLSLIGLSGVEGRYPHELSGGQQQRIALARALAPQPPLILLDEPLSNLDVQVRQRLRHEIRRILKATETSAIFVTHDREEALAISDKIGVMNFGNLEQIGTPEEIYTQPASRFVAEFVTQANFLPAVRQGSLWDTEIGKLDINTVAAVNSCDTGELMLPQEDIILQPDEMGKVVILDRQFLGREYRYCVETASGIRLHARTTINNQLSVGERVKLSVAKSCKIFPSLDRSA